MSIYYKAVRPDGTSFHDQEFRWIPEGWTPADGPVTVTHPKPSVGGAGGYLSVSVEPANCTGMRWPCRLLIVGPDGDTFTPEPDSLPHKRASFAWTVVGERPAHEALGPNGQAVVELIDLVRTLAADEIDALATARDAAWAAAWAAARVAAWAAARVAAQVAAREAAWYAAWVAAWVAAQDVAWAAARVAAQEAARDAAAALVVRDLISAEHYELLTYAWATIIGPAHPADIPIPAERNERTS